MRTSCVILLLTALLSVSDAGTGAEIHVAPGKYNDYYHIRFALTPDNCELTVPLPERRPKYKGSNVFEFAEGGQFEVFVRKDEFPVPAPHTDRIYLILRMPWTNPHKPAAPLSLSEKRKLFDAIRVMKTNGRGKVEVTVQLNPYVTLVEADPLRLELSGRNIFFRHAHGRYVDYVGPLR